MNRPVTILVIDDDPDLRRAMVRLLTQAGHLVTEAATGEQGLAAVKDRPPDLMIVDVVLPDMDGLEVIRLVRSLPGTQAIRPILVSSIRTASEDQAAGLEAGVCEYIARPMSNREFMARIAAVVNQKHRDEIVATELVELDGQLQAVFASPSICIFLADRNARMHRTNAALSRSFNKESHAMIGHRCGTAFGCVHAFDDPAGCGYGPRCRDCRMRLSIVDTFVNDAAHERVEAVLTCRQQDRIVEKVVILSTRRVSVAGQKQVLVCMQDITAQKAAETSLRDSEAQSQLLAKVIRLSSQPFAVGLPDGRLAMVNPAFCDMVGYDEAQLQQIDWNMDLTPPEWRALTADRLAVLKATGIPVRYDKEYITKDGRRVPVELLVHIQRDPNGEPLYYYAFVTDLSERRKAENERRNLQNQLHQAQKMEAIGALAGGVAHDFNNLLSIILGYGELVIGELPEDHGLAAPIRQILQAGIRGRELTRQLLAFSRKQMLEVKATDLNALIRGFEKMLRRLIGEDIALKMALAPEPMIVMADPSQIEQVLMNLAVNARDAMPDGGTLAITTAAVVWDGRRHQDPAQGAAASHALVCVSDTGTGMDSGTLERIFEPFFTTKDKEKGTGLGLATSYGIVQQHDGRIWAESEPGRGTTFRMLLPVCGQAPSDPSDRQQAPKPPTGSGTVMIVEDDANVHRMAQHILSKAGYLVLTTRNVQDAIDQARRHAGPIDLVLSDVVMPGMKGPEVFARIAESHPEARVLYMSGYTDDVIARHGIFQEGIDYLLKPFSVEGLLKKVGQVIGGH
jgi:PAS domain S-box-containing protein